MNPDGRKESTELGRLRERIAELERAAQRHAEVEEALRSSEERYRASFHQAPVAMLLIDAETGAVVDRNEKARSEVGLGDEALRGLERLGFETGDARDGAPQRLERILRRGTGAFVTRYQTASGEVRDIDVSTGVLSIQGRKLIQCVCHDAVEVRMALDAEITERKWAQSSLQKTEREFQAIFEQAAVGIAHVLLDGRFEKVNRKFCDIVGYSRAETTPRTLHELTHPEDLDDDLQYLRRVLEGEIDYYSTEKRLLRKNGSTVWVTLRVSLVREPSGEPGYFVAVLQDVSDRKQIEAERDRHVHELAGRVRVLDCLFAISRLASEDDRSLDATLREAIRLIPPAMQDPEKVCARIRFQGAEFTTPIFRTTKVGKSVSITIGEKNLGSVEVYLEEEASARGAILPEEVALLEELGRQLGRIAQHKQAEASLREAEGKFRTLFETAPVGIAVTTREGRLVQFNDAIVQITGYPPEELKRIGLRELYLDPTQRERLLKDVDSKGIVRGRRIVLKRADGRNCDVRSTLSPIVLGGKSVLLTVVEDVTEREREEIERERLLSAIEHSADVVVITDPEGTMQYVNPAFEQSTGYSRAEALGRNPRILKSGLHGEKFYGEMWATLKNGETWRGRLVNRRKDGTLYTGEATISPVRDGKGKVVNYVGTVRDITHELQLEEQLHQAQKLESVGRLAGGVAHDFNNMLSVILGNAEMALQQLAPSEPLRDDLQEILNAALRSADLTRQLLAFARKQTIAPRVLDLNETIASMLKMLGRMIGEDIELIWRPGTGLWQVKMDPGQVDQILANLVVNARDAIRGVGQISIETGKARFDELYCQEHPEFLPGDYIMLAVSDSGSGMDKATLASIFEPFFTTKPRGEGTGLGLATVYGIVKQNEGFINVYSEPGTGSTFRIYLPRSAEDGTMPRDDIETPDVERGTETILLVEDDGSLLKLSRRRIEQLGYNTLVAASPQEALELAQGYPETIHLLLTDVVMPGMSGLDLYRKLAESRPGLKCLYMSGYASDIIVHRGILDLGVHFLQKPFDVRVLAGRLREVLGE